MKTLGVRVDQMLNFDRITHEPGKMGGRACIRGLRVTVSMILGQIGAGRTNAEILADYPYLEAEDLSQALRYAADNLHFLRRSSF